jgi:hypothetical protein
MSDNLYGQSYYWWIGVVEDRMDPLFLGRCRVRIVGYHNPDKGTLPTADLPWAYPIMPVTSAGMSGVGTAPVGVVEGTWVTGFFRDGESMQEPVFTGVMGGVPQPETPVLVEQSTSGGSLESPAQNDYVPQSDAPQAKQKNVADSPPAPPKGVLGTLTEDDLQKLFSVLRQRESSNNYQAVNQLGFVGAYQFGAALLMDLGYLKKSADPIWKDFPKGENGLRPDFAAQCLSDAKITPAVYSRVPDKSKTFLNFFCLANDSYWTSRAGGSGTAFLNSSAIQDRCIREAFERQHKILKRSGVISDSTDAPTTAGFLFTAHLLGTGGAIKLKKGVEEADGNGTKATEYFDLGFRTITSRPPTSPTSVVAASPPPSNTATQKSNGVTSTTKTLGFMDPNNIYPRTDHIGEPDTNRLARNQKISETIVARKSEESIKNVPTGIEEESWSQPPVPYNAKYPFNHVIETESGHIIEFDDTPNNERIHIWHKTGTFIEVDRNGSRVDRVTGDQYTILERNGNVLVQGRLNLTVDGAVNIYVKNDCNLQVDGNLKQQVHGNYELNVAGDMKVSVGKNLQTKSNGNTNIEGKKNVNVKGSNSVKVSASKVSVKGSGGLGLESGGKISVLAPSMLTMVPGWKCLLPPVPDPFMFILPGSGASGASVDSPVPQKSPTEPTFPKLIIPNRADELAFTLSTLGENPEQNGAEIQKLKADLDSSGLIPKEEFLQEPVVQDQDTTPLQPKDTSKLVEVCTGVFDSDEFSGSFPLSTNYTLAMLTDKTHYSSYSLRAQHGLSTQDIVCNLMAVAENILEPIRKKYPNVIITSGFRHSGAGSGTSQHERGQAVDIQFLGASNAQYYEIAKWIRQNVVYDRLLLEYKTTGSGNPWIHLSFNRNGCANICSTYFNHATAPGGRGVLLNLA